MSESKSRSNVKRPSAVWLSIAGVTVLAVIAGVLVGVALTRQTPPVDANASLYTIPPEPTSTASPVVAVTRTDQPLKVLFVGGSLTGSVSASVDSKGFRSTMVRELRKTGAVTSAKSLYSTDSDTAVAGIADAGADQDIAVVELDPDDVGASSIDAFTSDYKALLSAVVATSPGINFVCAGVRQAPETGDQYDAVIARECEAQGGVFRALSDLRSVEANRGPAGVTGVVGGTRDDVHPNDTGYAAIAARLLQAIDIS
ncbi:SGNH/GDSL hydrolase family protein [Glaciihabitans sp. dw_435]|uniref:SGNH/GDSL hydrolase family protein n=1 Tax=Glaciihabitans sp. dw_435 TaxID=2720081 RepID=UPI001BD40EB9|nr:SGNH/GDSL hydrolase family protein [Glaciihabitans sp. dw_435]